MEDKAVLEELLGHQFDDQSLLDNALTHPSIGGGRSYQRLEFLGDRILGLIIAEKLYSQYPDMNEGDMALRYNDLVRRETLAMVADKMGLSPFIRLSVGEDDSGGREKPAILADVCEALIGALYLDGGLENARQFVEKYWRELVFLAKSTEKDGKTALQEWAQGKGLSTPVYQEINRTGPSHAPVFTIEVTLENGMNSTGVAGSKRGAEQNAAATLFAQIKEDSE